ncbi:MAG: hypothetical protein ACLU4N_19430 [Butyricimonas faecihominis]
MDDPEFDPANLKYSCVRYVPYTHENAEELPGPTRDGRVLMPVFLL